jgi:hypothetical protein
VALDSQPDPERDYLIILGGCAAPLERVEGYQDPLRALDPYLPF